MAIVVATVKATVMVTVMATVMATVIVTVMVTPMGMETVVAMVMDPLHHHHQMDVAVET